MTRRQEAIKEAARLREINAAFIRVLCVVVKECGIRGTFVVSPEQLAAVPKGARLEVHTEADGSLVFAAPEALAEERKGKV